MRLLEYNTNGKFSLTKNLTEKIPRYAILSHMWGADDEEVTFEDLMNSTGEDKAGYDKIRFCGEQADRDDLQHFWVDTCCIDKSSSAELQEAITSMFTWYRNADKCYAYLTDVPSRVDNQKTLEAAFLESRWFTRGWTLQELIAPRSVEFFCWNGNRLGDRNSLEGQLCEITGIPVSALRGAPLYEFSVDERMLWGVNRQTKRGEDKAYSLLGIFDISMPLIYGEGQAKALRRLQEAIDKSLNAQGGNPLDRLPRAIEAPFDSYSRQEEPTCLENTRADILREIDIWADGEDERYIFWLNGLAGTGKSTIARTIARRYSRKKQLGASFFFTRGGGDVSHAGKFVTSIASQLASSVPPLRWNICAAVNECGYIATKSLRDQWDQLVLRPLSKLDGNDCFSSYILVIDALDECDGDNNVPTILQLLAKARSLQKVRLRVFLTSRPEIPVRHGFTQIPDAERQDFILQSISPAIVDHDISLFLEYHLGLIGQDDEEEPGWPGPEAIQRLVNGASGLFIWAATDCRFIREGLSAEERLRLLLGGHDVLTTPEEHLNGIYTTVLRSAIQLSYTDQERQRLCSMLRHCLGSIVVLSSPLSVQSLSKLLLTTKQIINRTLKSLHAILDIPKDEKRLLHLHHPSFRDFLLNKNRCKDRNFWVDEKQAHQTLADNCIRLMKTSLKQDVCGLNTPSIFVTDVERSRIERSLPPELQYACLYWIRHIQESGSQLRDNDEVHQFLQEHLLHWLEALGWMGKISEGIHAITSLASITFTENSIEISGFLHDAKLFILSYHSIADLSPLQLYSSALIFAPKTSIVRNLFSRHCIPHWISQQPEVESGWNAALHMLERQKCEVRSVAFAPNSKLLASGSGHGTVSFWDMATGSVQQIIECYGSPVKLVAFSPDSKMLVSVPYDAFVKVWDTATGLLQLTLTVEGLGVSSVAFSPDSKQLTVVLYDGIIMVWDAATGLLLQVLECHDTSVQSIAFSPNSKLLAAVLEKTIQVWNTTTGSMRLFKEHSRISRVYFTPNSNLLASILYDATIYLWDTATGLLQQTLNVPSRSGLATFSPDSQLLAFVSWGTIHILDIAIGLLQQTVERHRSSVRLVIFSPDSKLLASASENEIIRILDAATGLPLQIFTYSGQFSYMFFSTKSWILITNVGHFALDIAGFTSLSISSPDGDSRDNRKRLGIRGSWVAWNKKNLLWLPPDFRPAAFHVSLTGSKIAIGCESGRILIIGLSPELLPGYYS